MSTKKYDSRTADKFVARLPEGLRAEIEAIADTTERSMNSVFVDAVRQYIDGQQRQELLLDALVNAVNLRTSQLKELEPIHIDDRLRMAANSRRYEWLRDRQVVEDASTAVLVMSGDTYFTGSELDKIVDDAMRLDAMEKTPCAQ